MKPSPYGIDTITGEVVEKVYKEQDHHDYITIRVPHPTVDYEDAKVIKLISLKTTSPIEYLVRESNWNKEPEHGPVFINARGTKINLVELEQGVLQGHYKIEPLVDAEDGVLPTE